MRRRLARALDRRFGALDAQTHELRGEVAASRNDLAELHQAIAELRPALGRMHDDVRQTGAALARLEKSVDDQVVGLLRELLIDDVGNRRRLEALRALPGYSRPYDEPNPLVSICVATRADRADLLAERSIPSALSQTHAHIEVVVVGDGFDPRSDPRVRALNDPRLRFAAVTHRVVERDPQRAWMTGATLPRQEARSIARGLWITDLDDDDALQPDAVASLLRRAREERAEVTSGLLAQHGPEGGEPTTIAGFPREFVPPWSGLPDDWRARACTAALWHPGLRFFTRVRAAALIGTPGDLFLTIRMARAGVRFAVLDRVVYDYYAGRLWDPERAAVPDPG